MDDSSVSQVSINTVLKQQAYLLFYIQSNTTPSRPGKDISHQAESSELDDTTPGLKRKHVEVPNSKEVQKEKVVLQNGLFKEPENSDDDDDPLGEMLFLAKKHKIELPAAATQTVTQKVSSSPPPSSETDREVCDRPSRLPPKRFGVFR